MDDRNELLESVKNEIEEEMIAHKAEEIEKQSSALRSNEETEEREDKEKKPEIAASEAAEPVETEEAADEQKDVVDEILEIILGDGDDEFIRTELDNYHENDIAEALTRLNKADRIRLYRILGDEKVSEIFALSFPMMSYWCSAKRQVFVVA